MVPHWLQLKRIDAYSEAVQQANVAFAMMNEAEIEKNRAAVLFAFQLDEAEALRERIAELSERSEDYFSLESLTGLAAASDDLSAELSGLTLNDAEHDLVAAASERIELHGYLWQTDFLNLGTTAVEELVESPEAERIVAVPDDDVTSEVLEDALAILTQAEAKRSAAERGLSVAQRRTESLSSAVEASLVPLAAAASEAPDQSEIVLEMYPGADPGVINQLRASALNASDSVNAARFTVDDAYVKVPVTGDPPEDQVSFEANDAWRATLIAAHLKLYAGAVTAAWITDAGSIEKALGFNPFLPF